MITPEEHNIKYNWLEVAVYLLATGAILGSTIIAVIYILK